MKKLIITGILSLSTLFIVAAQEPTTPPATVPDPSVAPAPAAAPAPAPAAAPAPAPAAAPSPQSSDNGGGKKLMFGLKFTPSYSWFGLDAEGVETDGGYIGYTYGVMMDFRLADNYYFGTGLEISQRGGKYSFDNVSGTIPPQTNKVDVTQRLQFVDIPLSLKLKTNEIGYTRYYGTFGFLGGFVVKANQDIDADDNADDRDKRDNMSDFGIFNFGLLVGAGLEYNISGNTSITAGLQYHNAFVDIWKADDAKLTSSYISLNLGIFF